MAFLPGSSPRMAAELEKAGFCCMFQDAAWALSLLSRVIKRDFLVFSARLKSLRRSPIILKVSPMVMFASDAMVAIGSPQA